MYKIVDCVDLHTHTYHSDGVLSPKSVVCAAADAGLCAVAITDHDTTDGVVEAMSYGDQIGIEVIPGVELGTYADGSEFHFLGYFVDATNPSFMNYLSSLQGTRKRRARAIVEKLRNLGLRLPYDAVAARAGDAAVGRPHIAKAMLDEGLVDSYQEAFDRWIGNGRPAHVTKSEERTAAVIQLIHCAGGVAVLAHPGANLSELILHRLIAEGLDGIEAVHPRHREATTLYYSRFAHKYGLLPTGGSDFHGGQKRGEIFGKYVVGYDVVEKLKLCHAMYARKME